MKRVRGWRVGAIALVTMARLLRVVAACLLLGACLHARGVEEAPELYLEVSVDGVKTGQVLPFRQGPHGLRASVQGLRDIGLDPQRFGVADKEEFELGAVTGLTWHYDAGAQAIDLILADNLRAPLQLQARSVRPGSAGQVDPGIVLDYDLYGQLGSAKRVAAFNEVRLFGARGLFASSGSAVLRGSGRRYTRYDSSWTWSDPATLQTVQAGDFVSPSLSWTRALRMGGIAWRRNFDLRPDLLTYPVAALRGSAVVPSSVSLYVNGVQQYSADVPSGPFVVDQVAGLNGAGQATIVTRDALGRSVAASLPLYVDTRLLASSLTDFAFALGAVRRDYGIRSFRYGDAPALTASGRHGWSDALTLEGHLEAGRGLVNAGAGALVRVGSAGGVLSGSLAGSRRNAGVADGARGMQASLGYQYIAPRFGLDLQSTRATGGYADLGTLEGTPASRINDRASLSLGLQRAGSASLSYVHYQAGQQQAVRLLALAWSRTLGHGAFFSLSGYRDLVKRDARGLMATLSFSLGERTALNAGAGRQGGQRSRSLTMSRAPDFGGGLGWGLQKGGSGDLDYAQAQVQYLGSAGQLVATTLQAGGARSSTVGLSGSLVGMDGTLVAARRVGRGFALVSTGVPGIPVMHENREIGRTGADGRLLVPDLMPYAGNQIAIDPSNLPADARIATTRLEVAPKAGAGLLAAFRIERYRAATLIVQDAGGKPQAPGTPVARTGGKPPTVVGYDGVVFLEDLDVDNEIVVGQGAGACTLRFAWHAGTEGQLPTIGPLRCAPNQQTSNKEQP